MRQVALEVRAHPCKHLDRGHIGEGGSGRKEVRQTHGSEHAKDRQEAEQREGERGRHGAILILDKLNTPLDALALSVRRELVELDAELFDSSLVLVEGRVSVAREGGDALALRREGSKHGTERLPHVGSILRASSVRTEVGTHSITI